MIKTAHMIINGDTFKDLPLEDQIYIMYTTLRSVEKKLYLLETSLPCSLNERLIILEKRKWWDKGISAVSGFFGGMVAILGLKFSKLG